MLETTAIAESAVSWISGMFIRETDLEGRTCRLSLSGHDTVDQETDDVSQSVSIEIADPFPIDSL
jgi:hypothetical protein